MARRNHSKDAGLLTSERLHVVTFEDPQKCVNAVHALRTAGLEVADVHTPYPVHGLAEAMGLAESRIGAATLTGGLFGLFLAGALALWTHTTDWPLDVGGKDNVAWQGIVPVMFEVTVLLGGLATAFGLFAKTRLIPRFPVGTPLSQPDPRVTNDRFAVVVREYDGTFRREVMRGIAATHGAVDVVEGWRVRG